MTSIHSIKFDTSAWTLESESSDALKWANDKREFLSLHYFSRPPDIPCAVNDLAALRTAYRAGLTQSGGALISADVVEAGGMDCVKLIFKTPRLRHGMVYVGSLTLPFADFSFVIKVQCAEFEVSGLRDAIVMERLLAEGKVTLDPETKAITGWSCDPYDPAFKATLLCHKSDDEAYDTEFPEHPLTEMRKHIATILSTIAADDEVLHSAKFAGAAEKSANGNGHLSGETSGNGAMKEPLLGSVSQSNPPSEPGKETSQRKGKPWWKVW